MYKKKQIITAKYQIQVSKVFKSSTTKYKMMSTLNTYATEYQNGYQQGLQSMGKIHIEQLYMNVRQGTHKKNMKKQTNLNK